MKKNGPLAALAILVLMACQEQTKTINTDPAAVKSEIREFIRTLDEAAETNSAEAYCNHFLQSDDLVVATQGYLMTGYPAVYDTIMVHFSQMEKQEIETTGERIDIINDEAAVVSTSKTTTITFRNGYQMTMPYALTMLIRKVNGEWKIAHYHN